MLSNNRQRNNGFSLLEALIAGFILFIVLVAVSTLMSGAMTSSERASKVATLHYQVPLIVEQVKHQIHQQNKLTGTGAWQRITYRWSAQPLKQATFWFDEYAGGNSAGDGQQLTLLQITLSVTLDNDTREFQFKEVTW